MTGIKFGVRWPDFDVPINKATIRDFVQATEDLGFDHVTTFDHIAGIGDETLGKHSHFPEHLEFGEALTMIAHMSGVTKSLGFLTDILNMGYRQTVLVAKQFSTLDLLTDGRMRLGMGIGAVEVEFKLLGMDDIFHERGARLEEQIEVLRLLWTTAPASFEGRWHNFPAVALNPLPPQQPIPIWMGMGWDPPERVLRRIAKYADGILPPWTPGDKAYEMRDKIFALAREAGRDPATIGLEPRINLRSGSGQGPDQAPRKTDEELAEHIGAWREFGAEFVEFKLRQCGLKGLDEHITEMANFMEIARSVLG
jgi:probable F420-dependent oxidoreductase